MSDVAARLVAAGMSATAAEMKETLYRLCARALHAQPVCASFFVPGRIELLGKHTDYAGGRSLLCTIERGFMVLARPRADAIVRVTDAISGETRELAFDGESKAVPGDWPNYVATVVQRVARNFPEAVRGADIAFASNLPPASGMSSSSALIVAIFLALSAVNDLPNTALYRAAIDSPETLAMYLAAVENGQSLGALSGDRGVGTQGGSEDHTAMLCCRAGHVSQYAFCPVRVERVIPFPSDYALIVAHSGVAAQKTGHARDSYNSAAAAAQRIVRIWNEATGRADQTLGSALASEPAAVERIRSALAEAREQRLIDRFNQFVLESYEIIPRASAALAEHDLAELGELVDRSQQAAERLLDNQIPETIALASLARSIGAVAASAFGAGFGGSVWALIAAADADEFVRRWGAGYQRTNPAAAARAEFIVTRPGPASVAL